MKKGKGKSENRPAQEIILILKLILKPDTFVTFNIRNEWKFLLLNIFATLFPLIRSEKEETQIQQQKQMFSRITFDIKFYPLIL